MHQIENSHIAEITPLISPRDLKAKPPCRPQSATWCWPPGTRSAIFCMVAIPSA